MHKGPAKCTAAGADCPKCGWADAVLGPGVRAAGRAGEAGAAISLLTPAEAAYREELAAALADAARRAGGGEEGAGPAVREPGFRTEGEADEEDEGDEAADGEGGEGAKGGARRAAAAAFRPYGRLSKAQVRAARLHAVLPARPVAPAWLP
jgi:hypothetical protein